MKVPSQLKKPEIYQAFRANFELLRSATGHDFNRLFSDYLELTLRSFHPRSIAQASSGGVISPDADNEKHYLETIQAERYTSKTTSVFAQLD